MVDYPCNLWLNKDLQPNPGKKLTTSEDFWNTFDDFWITLECCLKTSEDFWRLLMTSDDCLASLHDCENWFLMLRTRFLLLN